MNSNPDRCIQLRKLHAQLTNEVKLLRESIQKAEQNGVDTSIETLNSIKHLQASLRTISLELEKCPPEVVEIVPTITPAQVKVGKTSRSWFPDAEEDDVDFESVVDEP
ncbi:hypothetical protein [Tengunoibacter tsumagoiensis]|uniref:Uncharacterized protein n=1 Tax=Tengunoibacter tsumagoiensis TaxID=2014871 RepID=A0A402A1W2_9CHLR|nr:hypothetical protein [Tengunoibacter tsumagoiensis]GCE13140.1 hypothetical protein KTT_29990 [Tengunoibacter tsumagoiensis]